MDRHATGQDRRQRRGARRLDDLLEPLDRKPHAGQDRRIVEQDDPVEVAPAHRQRPDAGERRTQTVGDAVRLDRHDLVPLERERHRIRTLRLDPVDADRWPALLDRGRHAGDQSPTTDAHDHYVEVGQVLDHLEADRTVAGDHRRIVEGVHELEAFGIADPFELGQQFADVRAVQDDPGTVATARVDLRTNGAGGHDDGHRDTRRAAGPGIRLTCVPGRQRDDAPCPGRLGQGRDPVRHPARLERSGLLELFGLEIQPIVRQPHAGRDGRPGRCRGGIDQGRPVDQTGQPLACRLDVGERDDVILGFGHRRMVPRQARRGTCRLGRSETSAARPLLACLRKR